MTTALTKKSAKRAGRKKAPPASAKATANLSAEESTEAPAPSEEPTESSAPAEAIALIELDRIEPSPRNPRRLRDSGNDSRVNEIAESIKSVGVLHPILLRPVNSHFEIMAGERRWRAARLAGLASIPAIVRELDDKAALEITVVENMQREDLHPIEEARGLKDLLEAGYTNDEAASRLGKSRAWIACRAQLAELIPELAAAALGADERLDLTRWSVRALELVARLPEPTQRMLWEKLLEHIEVSPHEKQRIEHATTPAIDSLVDRFMRNLPAAAWDLTATYDGIPPCAQCSKRSQAQPDLFGEDANDEDQCLDPQCWERKTIAHAEQFIAEAERQYPGIVKVSSNYRTDLPGVLSHEHYARSGEGAEGAVPAVVVEGAPEIVWIRVGPDDQAQRRASRATGPKAAIEEDAIVARKAQYDKLRRRIVMDLLAAKLKDLVEEGVGETCAVTPQKVMACLLATGLPFSHLSTLEYTSPWPLVEANLKKSEGELMMELALQMAKAFDKRLHSFYNEPKWAEALAIAEVFGIDLAALLREAAARKPYPKSWRARAEALPPSPLPESAFFTARGLLAEPEPTVEEAEQSPANEPTVEGDESGAENNVGDNSNENSEEKAGDAGDDLDDDDPGSLE